MSLKRGSIRAPVNVFKGCTILTSDNGRLTAAQRGLGDIAVCLKAQA